MIETWPETLAVNLNMVKQKKTSQGCFLWRSYQCQLVWLDFSDQQLGNVRDMMI